MIALTDLKVGQEPEVGKNYLVPCLNISKIKISDGLAYQFKDFLKDMVALPVIGNSHKDPEFRNAGGKEQHWHLDIRFMTEADFKAWNIPVNNGLIGRFNFPILPMNEIKEQVTTFLRPKTCYRQLCDVSPIRIGEGYDYHNFENEMEKHTIDLENPVCAHHGTSLKSQCVRNGKVTCPLHGAVWDVVTGKFVRKTYRVSEKQQQDIDLEKAIMENSA